jgi:predicted transcriptional regulator
MHDLTNAEFSELTGIGVSTLYTIKAGHQAPSMAQFVAILNVVDLEPSIFFKKGLKPKNGK